VPRKPRSRLVVRASVPIAQSPLNFADLSELVGYRLRRAQGSVHRDFMTAVGAHKLTQKQTAVLWLVAHNPGVAQGALGSALGMDRATMMALVDRMQDRGLITRARSLVDARRRELHATPSGSRLMNEIRKRIAVHEARLKRLYSARELQTLLKLLERLQNLGMNGADK